MTSAPNFSINIEKNREQIVKKLAELITRVSKQKILQQDIFNIGVSGGSLVGLLRDALSDVETDFSKWRVFFCDERLVAEDSPDSTYGQYKRYLNNILRDDQFITIKQGVSVDEAAIDYAQKMGQYFETTSFPKFDMLLLGMGPDGHTCSLFPGHRVLEENTKWVASIMDSPKPPSERITLTLPVINRALYCVFAVYGHEKADTIKKILIEKQDLPAGRVKPFNGNLLWIIDEDAGRYVKNMIKLNV